jgi:hypothetical protein
MQPVPEPFSQELGVTAPALFGKESALPTHKHNGRDV